MANARRRYLRTIILGVAAMALLVWSAMDQFGIPREEMLGLFYGVLAGAAGIIVLAALLATVWAVVRRLSGRGNREQGRDKSDVD